MTRLNTTLRLTAVLLLACLAAACGTTRESLPLDQSAATSGTGESSAAPAETAADRISVVFRDDAEQLALPAELRAHSAQAHLRSNAILRPRSAYEDIADSIAEHYGLSLGEQVYYGHVLVAGFGLPAGTDAEALLADLATRYADWVDWSGLSPLYRPAFSPDDPEYIASDDSSGGQWNLKHMHIEKAWEHGLGKPGLLMCIVDTGVNMTHTDLSSALQDPAVLFPGTNCDIANDDATIEDHHGHGSFICGQIAAASDNATGIAGACPGISVFPVKISESGQQEPLERIIAGCVLAHALGAKVISMSWGGGGNEAMEAMTQDLAADGTLLVCSAGNYGNTFVTFPGAYPDAMAVGNSMPDESRFVTSSYGPALDVVAPGWNLTSIENDDDFALKSGGSGTSYATPLVSSAAALLWSLRPELTLGEMRGLLETSGPEASDFGEGVHVRRLDFGSLFDNAVNPGIRFVPPTGIVQRDSMELGFSVRGTPELVSLRIDSKQPILLDGPEWSTDLSLAGVSPGTHQLSVQAFFSGGISASDQLPIMVAGPALAMPLSEQFTGSFGICSPLDLSLYDPAAMGELALQDYSGQEEQFRQLGVADWYLEQDAATVPQYQAQIGATGYGRLELDAVVTQPVAVPDSGNPTLALEHHCNIADALQQILVTDDYGASWQPLLTTEAELPPMGGFILPHTKLILDLAPYRGKSVCVMFLLAAEADSTAQWEQFTWGWWLDVLSFGDSGWLDIPVASLSATQPLVFGAVPGNSVLSVAPGDDNELAAAAWWLDFPALQIELPPDQRVTVSGGEVHGYAFNLASVVGSGNNTLRLHLQVTDINGNISKELFTPVYQYDLAGDVNADGSVNSADSTALLQVLRGTLPATPFCDCNADGSVDELDNTVIAYGFGGQSTP